MKIMFLMLSSISFFFLIFNKILNIQPTASSRLDIEYRISNNEPAANFTYITNFQMNLTTRYCVAALKLVKNYTDHRKELDALKSLCRSPWSMCILTMDTNTFITKWCFGDGNVFVDLSLLNILVATIISIYY